MWGDLRGLEEELIRLESDGSQSGGAEPPYQAKLAELLSLYQEAKALQNWTWRRLLIRSEVLDGALVWVVKDEGGPG